MVTANCPEENDKTKVISDLLVSGIGWEMMPETIGDNMIRLKQSNSANDNLIIYDYDVSIWCITMSVNDDTMCLVEAWNIKCTLLFLSVPQKADSSKIVALCTENIFTPLILFPNVCLSLCFGRPGPWDQTLEGTTDTIYNYDYNCRGMWLSWTNSGW